MNGFFGIFSSVFNLIADFGETYADTAVLFFNSVFRRPLWFILKSIRRLIRTLFRSLVILFAPWEVDSKDYADAVTRAAKGCVRVLFSHPGSFVSVVIYYIKKAFTRYDFGIKTLSVWVIPAVFAVIAVLGFNMLSEKSVALKIEADGEILGYVQTEEGYLSAKNQAEEILKFSDGKNTGLPEVTYSYALIDINRFTDSSTLCERLIEKSGTSLIPACAVYSDGELLAVLHSENDARAVLNSILSEKEAESNYVVSFAENIEYRQVLYPESKVSSKNEFIKKLTSGSKTQTEYITKIGDTPDSVASANGMTKDLLLSLNETEASAEVFEEGTKLIIEKPSYLLSFKEVRTEVSAEEIDFDKIEIQSKALYSGSSRVLVQGKKGYDQVTSFVTFIDGKKVSSSEVSRLTITDAVPERVQVGTKPLDEAYSNSMGGIFLWPIVGAYGINSDYGYRWGKLHAGLDLGMGGAEGTSLGKTIIAVAQGTVIVAGVHSSYGYYVIIDHGNSLQTLYAHCLADSLMVVPGQVVVAGQPIARVGSTGYSTGPHLHFEVRVNGNRVSPRPYLGI
ncbi:MAG: peptidoglycan DD-metalloendopeptidase family protein [Clostridia bacterium]|nr:peptidoglycan DD-metalloendopeptidase family protein [Clostridia bacterium]